MLMIMMMAVGVDNIYEGWSACVEMECLCGDGVLVWSFV